MEHSNAADAIPDFGTAKRFLISGGTGFIGTALVQMLLAQGHAVTVLTRRGPAAAAHFGGRVVCIAHCRELPDDAAFDVVVNLAGAPVVGAPWTARRRRVLLHSRLGTTQQLLDFVQRSTHRPALWLQASAIGFYGTDSTRRCDEDSAAGGGFAADLCREWEDLTASLPALGLRRVVFRFGLVFGRGGGSFPPLALPFRFGLGSVIGSGDQSLAWVHLDDVLGAMAWALRNPGLQGVCNVVAPQTTSYRAFAQTLAEQLGRPLWLRVPAPVLRLMLGEMADMLTEGPGIVPRRLPESGYRFRYPTLPAALAALIAERAPGQPD